MINIPILVKNDGWRQHGDKLMEEANELAKAIDNNDKENLVEELFDVAEVLIGIADKLNDEGIGLTEGCFKHRSKLIKRGWKTKGIVRVKILRF